MEKSQFEFLMKRISAVSQPGYPSRAERAAKEPAHIKAARKLLERYDQQQDKSGTRARQIFRRHRLTVEETVHKGNYEKALLMVQVFEKRYEDESNG